MQKITDLRRHIDRINKILSDNQKYFCDGTPNVVRMKENPISKGVYEIIHSSLFLRSTHKKIISCIKIQETWINDKRVEYSYRFEIPYVEYVFACMLNKKTGYKTFEFRYESHANKEQKEDRAENRKEYPKDHLHVLDNVPPHYNVHKPIEFEDFFNIIKNDFINDDNLIDFRY
ncbi:MAG: hypothetical protein Q7R99_03415 [bacterium]|nr:hypothetical protein [bacterium]